ncbi:MAG: HAD family hydrolase [Gammaproteobacteria bacterium]|nr:HAD family hydrolase [Gammaproteobacteria bacterium]
MLKGKRYWIFDMDGTLTVAQHDFDAIRAELDLPLNEPILEALDRLPAIQADARMRQLDAIELDLAASARAQEGAGELLEQLCRQAFHLGILTRNARGSAMKTLASCGLDKFFSDEDVISRGCVRPKPDPDGIHRLLNRWQGHPDQTVMIGDFLFDVQCGRNAGTTTVYFDPQGDNLWNEYADLVVSSLKELTRALGSGLVL